MASKNTIVRFINMVAPAVSIISPALAGRWLATLFCTPHRRAPLPREKKWLEGSTLSSVSFEENYNLPIWTWGEGPAILLVHGWSGRGSQMAVMARPLVDAGFKVVAFDLPGHGDAGGKLSALPMFAKAIRLVADQVGPLHGVIAHSLGTSGVSLALAAGLNVEKVVYLAPPENMPIYLERAGTFLGFGSGIAARAQKHLENIYGVPLKNARAPVIGPAMKASLLVIHDDTDKEVLLEEGRLVVKHWPEAEMIVTHGHGHHRLVRNPEAVEMAVGFLKKAMKKNQAV